MKPENGCRGLAALVVFSLVAMALLARVDFEWTIWLSRNRVDCWGDFMRRTMFEGGVFGGSDPGILLMVLPSIGYFLSRPQSRFRLLWRWRPYLGFIFFTSLVTGLGLVHSLKWMVGRARPYLVIEKGLPFSHWFEFGPLHVSDGIFFGSLPSGHTATAIVMISFSYILAGNRSHSLRLKAAGWIWGLLVLVYALLMAIGRSMTLDHWLSDSVGIILLDWAAIHLIYFHVLKIPHQSSYTRIMGSRPLPARYWELQLIWRLLVITLAVMAAIIGFKALLFNEAPLLVLMLIPALPVIYYTCRNLFRTYRDIMAHFGG